MDEFGDDPELWMKGILVVWPSLVLVATIAFGRTQGVTQEGTDPAPDLNAKASTAQEKAWLAF